MRPRAAAGRGARASRASGPLRRAFRRLRDTQGEGAAGGDGGAFWGGDGVCRATAERGGGVRGFDGSSRRTPGPIITGFACCGRYLPQCFVETTRGMGPGVRRDDSCRGVLTTESYDRDLPDEAGEVFDRCSMA